MDSRAPPASRWNGRISITITLTMAISLLVLVSVGSVLSVGVWLAQKNTLDLLSTNANQSVLNTVKRIEQHLVPAVHQTEFVAKRIVQAKIAPDDKQRLGRLLLGALAAARQVEAIIFIDPRLRAVSAGRDRSRGTAEVQVTDYTGDKQIRQRMDAVTEKPAWTPPIWRQRYKKTYLNLR